MINLLDESWIPVFFGDEPGFLDFNYETYGATTEPNYIDLGTDNQHPGPNQHKQYADTILKFLKENNHGKTI